MAQQPFETRYLKPGGKFYLAGRRLGQVSSAKLTLELETDEKDNFEGGGGLDDVSVSYKKVSLEITARNIDKENLALAYGADSLAVVGAAVEDQPFTSLLNGLARVNGAIDTTKPVVVKNATVVVDPAFYNYSAAGITILDDSIVDGTELTWTGTTANGSKLEAALNKGTTAPLTLDSVNDSGVGEFQIYDFWKAKVLPVSSADLISLEDIELTFTIEILADGTKGKSGVPESPFFAMFDSQV